MHWKRNPRLKCNYIIGYFPSSEQDVCSPLRKFTWPFNFFLCNGSCSSTSSVSSLWSWGRCTHAPLIGLHALSGVSWMRASLTRLPKPPQNCCDGEDQEKSLWIFDLFVARDFYSQPKVTCFVSHGVDLPQQHCILFSAECVWYLPGILHRLLSSASRISETRVTCLWWKTRWTGWWRGTTFGWGRISEVKQQQPWIWTSWCEDAVRSSTHV